MGEQIAGDDTTGEPGLGASATGKTVAWGVVFVLGFGWIALAYLSRHPPTAQALVVLPLSVAIFAAAALLAFRPGRLAPGLVPTRAWWGLALLTAALAVTMRAIGGTEWFVLVAMAAAALGAGGGRSIGLAPTFALVVANAVVASVTGQSSLDVGLEAVFVLLSVWFGREAWRRNALMQELRVTRHQLAGLAVSRERERIARDLHDLLGNTLTTATVKLRISGRLLDTDVEAARHEIGEALSLLSMALDEVRSTVAGYRSPSLREELQSAVSVLELSGVTVELHAPEVDRIEGEQAVVLAWVLREAVTNIVRHSRAATCRIELVRDQHGVVLQIDDDGRGSPAPTRTPSGSGGSGLAGMRTRLEAVGGTLTLTRPQGRGFGLRAEIPLERVAPAEAASEGLDR